MELNGKD